MGTIGQRMTLVLEELGLKKIDMAKRLKISSASVSTMCSGKTNPSGQTVTMFCHEFNVNEEWLRTGVGEMFCRKDEDFVDDLAKRHGLSPEFADLLRKMALLPRDVQQNLVDIAFNIAGVKPSDTETPSQRDARLLREEADAVEQEGERLSASLWENDA